MRRRTSSGRRAVDAPSPVPAVLPLVVFEAQDGDRLVVIVDGDKLAAAPVHRSEIGRVLTELVTKLAVPTQPMSPYEKPRVSRIDGSTMPKANLAMPSTHIDTTTPTATMTHP